MTNHQSTRLIRIIAMRRANQMMFHRHNQSLALVLRPPSISLLRHSPSQVVHPTRIPPPHRRMHLAQHQQLAALRSDQPLPLLGLVLLQPSVHQPQHRLQRRNSRLPSQYLGQDQLLRCLDLARHLQAASACWLRQQIKVKVLGLRKRKLHQRAKNQPNLQQRLLDLEQPYQNLGVKRLIHLEHLALQVPLFLRLQWLQEWLSLCLARRKKKNNHQQRKGQNHQKLQTNADQNPAKLLPSKRPTHSQPLALERKQHKHSTASLQMPMDAKLHYHHRSLRRWLMKLVRASTVTRWTSSLPQSIKMIRAT
mmetsp:Transcript_32678/g.66716  ORF Transcript_32678/g.66716 Transcript_32678/m.66716 type:complete len:308 (+) Transcript_32678:1673-2596(+)